MRLVDSGDDRTRRTESRNSASGPIVVDVGASMNHLGAKAIAFPPTDFHDAMASCWLAMLYGIGESPIMFAPLIQLLGTVAAKDEARELPEDIPSSRVKTTRLPVSVASNFCRCLLKNSSSYGSC